MNKEIRLLIFVRRYSIFAVSHATYRTYLGIK